MLLKQKSDTIGALSSSLCLIHCVFTPFLFVLQSHSSCCSVSTPLWWKSIDYIFLAISFFAVYKSGKETSKTWVKHGFYICWLLLFFIVINERVRWLALSNYAIYIPSLSLVLYMFITTSIVNVLKTVVVQVNKI